MYEGDVEKIYQDKWRQEDTCYKAVVLPDKNLHGFLVYKYPAKRGGGRKRQKGNTAFYEADFSRCRISGTSWKERRGGHGTGSTGACRDSGSWVRYALVRGLYG